MIGIIARWGKKVADLWRDDPEFDYALVVPSRNNWHAADIVDGFDRTVGYVYLWGSGSPDAIWLVQLSAIWTDLSVWLFDDRYREQKKFRSCEEAIRFIERRLGLTRCAKSPFEGAVNPRAQQDPRTGEPLPATPKEP